MEPITLDAVARAFPKLKIIMAHFTADNRKESISGMLMWLPNVYADLTNVTWYFPRHHTLYMGKLIKELMGKNIPREKLIFGTDTVTSNLHMVPKQRKTVEEVLKVAQFKKSEIEMIMGGTMNSWFPEGVGRMARTRNFGASTLLLGRIGRKLIQHRLDVQVQSRDMLPRRFIHTIPVNGEVIVHENMAHACNLPPGDLRILQLEIVGQAPSRFTNDLDVPQNVGLPHLVSVEVSERLRRRADDLGD